MQHSLEKKKNVTSEFYQEYKNIFNVIINKINNNEYKIDQVMKNIINYFDIKNNDSLIFDLNIIFKSKIYEKDLKSIIYFFDILKTDNNRLIKILPNNYEKLSEKNIEELKIDLNNLKNKKIYDFENTNYYLKLFDSFYGKKYKLEFLLSKLNNEEKTQALNDKLSKVDIQNIDICMKNLKKLINSGDSLEIYNNIKKLPEKQIDEFIRYSKIFNLIQEFENINFFDNIIESVKNIVTKVTFNLSNDEEKCTYGENKAKITIQELINLKNKISIYTKEDIGEENLNILNFFQKFVSNLEELFKLMIILREKGSIFPISIKIIIKYPKKYIYKINEESKTFDEIRDFLILAQKEYDSILDIIYPNKENVRFLHGKLLNRILLKHSEKNNSNLDDILRFILNEININKRVKDGKFENVDDDDIKDFKKITESKFSNISNYIQSIFNKNKTSIEQHYKKMLIKEKKRSKGIFIHTCENENKERFIVNLYLDKIGILPVAQNILICSKETLNEEIIAFLYRAILCNYNTLFIISVNDSFSKVQQEDLNNYLNKLIKYNLDKKDNKIDVNNINIKDINDNLNSCIVFVYNKNNQNTIQLLNDLGIKLQEIQIEKSNGYNFFDSKDSGTSEERIDTFSRSNSLCTIPSNYLSLKNDNEEYSYLENTKVFSSEICGLGKSHEIRKIIESNNKLYFYFQLGGFLEKNIIFKKLSNLLNKIKKENEDEDEDNYKNIAIHLDLNESNEIDLLNEFLFSFLITKFYSNGKDIIYIPNNIEIYIEIPNCNYDYLSKFQILSFFNITHITLHNMPLLDLDKDTRTILNKILGYKEDEEIEKFIVKYIANENKQYSYHKLSIFIKLFIHNYLTYEKTMKSVKRNRNITKEFVMEFEKNPNSYINNCFYELILNNNNKKDYADLLSEAYDKDCKNKIHSVFSYGEKTTLEQSIKDFLFKIKTMFNLSNEIDKNINDNNKSLITLLNSDDYIVTNNNLNKMDLIIERIAANIPTIIMGESGCGKTKLITKLNQIINNGNISLKIININNNTTDEQIYEKIKAINKEANNTNDKIWIIFDKINHCSSFCLLKEIFVNRSFYGEKIKENIILLGECNPYRKINNYNKICGLNIDNEYDELRNKNNILPFSLLYYIFIFGILNDEDEKKCIYSKIQKLFNNKEEKKLHEATKETIFECHKFLRNNFYSSIISLRDISKFIKFVEFFKEYYSIKDECETDKNSEKKDKKDIKLNKIKSIICSIYLCYYIRIIDENKKEEFNLHLQNHLLKLVNSIGNNINKDDNNVELIFKIKYKELYEYLKDKNFKQFSDILKIEEEFLINKLELYDGIGKTDVLKENVFLTFVSLITKIPLILIGNPGSGKKLCIQLIYKAMKGKYSRDKFFQKYPKLIQTYFKCSESTNPEDIKKLFEIAEDKYKTYKNDIPISMIELDEIGLLEKGESDILSIINTKIDENYEGISFIGISNYAFTTSKINKAFILSIPDLSNKDEILYNTIKSIVKSISENLTEKKIFNILSKTYFEYKETLKLIQQLIGKNNEIKINELKKLSKKIHPINIDFHGNIDFFCFIKEIAKEAKNLENYSENNMSIIVEKYIERNFGGIYYKLDIDFNIIFPELEEKINRLKKILDTPKNHKEERKEKIEEKKIEEINEISSVCLFKKIYNFVCESEKDDYFKECKIDFDNIEKYDFNRCINDYINNDTNRYLLIEINNNSLSQIIYQNIKEQNPNELISFYDETPFIEDDEEYLLKKLSEIQEDAKTGKIIILHNLNKIHKYLYDLYDFNFLSMDERKYCRIHLGKFEQKFIEVNNSSKIIIIADEPYLNKLDTSFINKFEKINVNFLNKEQKKLTQKLLNEMNLNSIITNDEIKINYSLENLLIYGKEEIESLIYYIYNFENKNLSLKKEELKKEIYSIIIKVLPQDIICILPDIKIMYYENNKYYNYKDYITEDSNKKYKVSTIYTFTDISNNIEAINNEMKIKMSEIKTDIELKNVIDEKIKNLKCESSDKIIIQFEQTNSNKIGYIISNFIDKYYREKKYENIKFILIIHITRNFFKNKEKLNSLINVGNDINQIFIDNLNGPKISLENLLEGNIINFINNNSNIININSEFTKALNSFLDSGINIINKNSSDKKIKHTLEFISEIRNILLSDENFKYKVIKKIKLIIKNKKFKNYMDNFFEINYINKNSQDIITCMIEYIKVEIIGKYLKYIFEALEDNNILTTLTNINKNKNDKEKIIDEDILDKLLDNSLDMISIDDKKNFEPKFLPNYILPGFFKFYQNLSNYINENIAANYFNNERDLINKELVCKELKNLNKYEKIMCEALENFYEEEEDLSLSVFDEIKKDKFIFGIKNWINLDLIIRDYYNYYFYENNLNHLNDDLNLKLIEMITYIRFNEEKRFVKNNINSQLKFIIIMMIWIEASKKFILNIFKIFQNAKDIFDNEDELFNKIKIRIDNEYNIYILNEKKKSKNYKIDVYDCINIFLNCLFNCILEEIEIKKDNIENNYEILLNIKIIQNEMKNDLNLNLKEKENTYFEKLMEIVENKIGINLININSKNYKIIKELGKVKKDDMKIFKVFNDEQNKFFVIKELLIKNNDIKNLEIIKKEAELLSKFKSNYVVKYYDSEINNNKYYILMEYCDDKDLRYFLNEYKSINRLPEEKLIYNIIKQICLGIKEIHSKDVVHRDLKPENIFMNKNGEIKIGDFGISKILDSKEKSTYTTNNQAGTSDYMAPEIDETKKYNKKADIFQLGCIFYELFNLSNYCRDKARDKIKEIDYTYNSKWQELINSLLQTEYDNRPDIEKIINYLNKIKIN